MTGDVSRNPGGKVVVMTTEVLRNMIYAAPGALGDLGCVVLDEVHYLEDRYRGSVWEEIILSAPEHIVLVCLSATVSNAEELAAWIESVRGSVAPVIEERRPIELQHLYVAREAAAEATSSSIFPTFVNGLPNPEALALDARAARTVLPHARGGGRYGLAPNRRTTPSHGARSSSASTSADLAPGAWPTSSSPATAVTRRCASASMTGSG